MDISAEPAALMSLPVFSMRRVFCMDAVVLFKNNAPPPSVPVAVLQVNVESLTLISAPDSEKTDIAPPLSPELLLWKVLLVILM